jgi:hypothetical protein
MFLHGNIHKYTWTSPDGKTHNYCDNILRDRRWHSSIINIRSLRGADCDIDHYLVFAKFTKRFAASKQTTQKFEEEDISGS